MDASAAPGESLLSKIEYSPSTLTGADVEARDLEIARTELQERSADELAELRQKINAARSDKELEKKDAKEVAEIRVALDQLDEEIAKLESRPAAEVLQAAAENDPTGGEFKEALSGFQKTLQSMMSILPLPVLKWFTGWEWAKAIVQPMIDEQEVQNAIEGVLKPAVLTKDEQHDTQSMDELHRQHEALLLVLTPEEQKRLPFAEFIRQKAIAAKKVGQKNYSLADLERSQTRGEKAAEEKSRSKDVEEEQKRVEEGKARVEEKEKEQKKLEGINVRELAEQDKNISAGINIYILAKAINKCAGAGSITVDEKLAEKYIKKELSGDTEWKKVAQEILTWLQAAKGETTLGLTIDSWGGEDLEESTGEFGSNDSDILPGFRNDLMENPAVAVRRLIQMTKAQYEDEDNVALMNTMPSFQKFLTDESTKIFDEPWYVEAPAAAPAPTETAAATPPAGSAPTETPKAIA